MKSPKIHFIVALSVFLVMLAGYGLLFSHISTESSDATSRDQQIATAIAEMNHTASDRTALAQVADDEATVQSYFVTQDSIVSFINELETRGKSLGAGVTVLSVSTGGTAAEPTLLFSLAIQGSFDAVMRTVGAIEYAPHDISIGTASINRGTIKGDDWQATLNLVVGALVTASTTETTSERQSSNS